MGSASSSVRPISFPSPKTLSTDRPEQIGLESLWIYFPAVGYNRGVVYPNAGRGWWVKFDVEEDIQRVNGLNGALSILFRPGQALAMNIPQNKGFVLMGTNYQFSINNDSVSMIVPYKNVATSA